MGPIDVITGLWSIPKEYFKQSISYLLGFIFNTVDWWDMNYRHPLSCQHSLPLTSYLFQSTSGFAYYNDWKRLMKRLVLTSRCWHWFTDHYGLRECTTLSLTWAVDRCHSLKPCSIDISILICGSRLKFSGRNQMNKSKENKTVN